ncbi:MAG: polysaccharide biosynthesis/export family protein [Akkermansiaceae bacterium]|jgi:polysaccharide biosynthesis/export protein VpsN|nr:polysaccharide biosynthesis/export family protein [Akkermansiaceae bacterium]MDP4647933.1 polysaccharide biosynthesis/export family protein [Akkermansiaceae bacterium]MDP4719723.1 polysaccharide biosynthesis/export family protein [Akkermansiaceae bacterium]MDP4781278.1 polysaccharide biosynthesis/export family protein [Akkermansiaceae bacterium]MDP4846034.1 polysaccharide biosynthesis/export family protein [Akkermansiaceae bacterium]
MAPRSLVTAFLFLIFLVSPSLAEIEPGTSVKINILGVALEEKGKIDSIYPVSEDGMVNMPFIGKLRAGGLKAETFATTVENAYKAAEIYQNPTIQVIDNREMGDPKDQTVFVGGHVRKTGAVSWQQHLTIYQAIQAAGGADEFGSMKRVRLYREGRMSTYDLRDHEAKQILVEPKDTIEVPEKGPFGG